MAPSTTRDVRFVTFVSIILNIVLASLKGIVGAMAGSQSLIADALHSSSDLLGDFLIIIAVPFWNKPPDDTHPYGHRRIETLTAVAVGFLLLITVMALGWKIVTRTVTGSHTIPGIAALYVALISIVCKELLYRWTLHKAEKLHSASLRANAWHHRSDAFSSIPVAISVLSSQFFPSLWFLDSIAAIIVLAMLLHAIYRILWPAFHELTEGSVSVEIRDEIMAIASRHPQVREIHRLRTRRIGGRIHVDMHLLVDGNMSILNGHEVSDQVKAELMARRPDIADVLIHIEPYP
ncbi:MAG: cation transporter, partial [Lentisphaerae bacterium]